MFLRFVITQLDNVSHKPQGLFVAADDLLESGVLSQDERLQLREIIIWFNKNLPSPRYEFASRRIFWFKSSAEDCVKRMWELTQRSAASVGVKLIKAKLRMNYHVVTQSVGPQLLAAVRRRVQVADVGRVWKSALDIVWEFLRQHEGLRTDGHNCFLYHHPAPGERGMVVDFGVQVIRPFEDVGEIICTETPAGEVAMTTHIGSYGKLAAAHEAIDSWRRTTDRRFGAYSWEIYGDWSDNEAKLETQVVYLLS